MEPAADGEADRRGPNLTRRVAIEETCGDVAAPAGERRDTHRGVEGYATLRQDRSQVPGDVGVKAGEDLGVLPDNGHDGTEVVEDRSHLEPDGSGADKYEAAGELG